MVTFCDWGWRDKQKDILQKESPGRVLQERCSKIFGKTYWKTRVQRPFSKEVSGCRPATLFKKRLMQRFFSVTFSEQLFYSIVQTWIAASYLIENLETLTISEQADGEIADKIKNCDKLFKKFKKSKLHIDKDIYNASRYKVRKMIFDKKRSFLKKNYT